MSTLGGSRGERNAKPKFAALDINKLYITSRGETLEPSSQKSAAPRKHGMQSLGKVPTARRPPANLPSLKAEVNNPGDQSGSWTSDQIEGANVNSSPSNRAEKSTSSSSQGNSNNTHYQALSQKNSKTCETKWNTNEFPSLGDAGSCGLNANKPQHFQDPYPGAPQLMLRPQTDAASWMQQKGSSARGTAAGSAGEMTDGGVTNGSSSSQNTPSTTQASPLPPQFRALLPTFMQRGSDGGSAGSENEGGSPSPGLSQPSPFSIASSSYNDPKHNSNTHGISNNNLGDNNASNNKKQNSKIINITTVGNSSSSSSSTTSSSSNYNNNASSMNNSSYDDNNGKMLGKTQNPFSQKQSSQLLGSHHDHPQQINRMGGGNNFSGMPSGRGARVTGRLGGVGDGGGAERATGTVYNDNHQYANRRGASSHPSRYANRNTMGGGGLGNHNASAGGHSRGVGTGSAAIASDPNGPGGFHDDNRNSHPPYGASVLVEQEVVVRPIIRDEELQRLEAIAKDEGWAKDYEFDYNQKLEFSDDESDCATTTAPKDKETTLSKPEMRTTTGVDDDNDWSQPRKETGMGQQADRDGGKDQDQGNASMPANGSSGRGLPGGDCVAVTVNPNVVGGLDAADAKERIKQRREEDQRREMERKQAAARKLQELEQKLSRKKVEESGDTNPSNTDTTSAGNVTSSSSSSKLEEEKPDETGTEQQPSERIISVKIRGKNDERGSFKEIRYEIGSGGLRQDRDREAGSTLGGGGVGNSWDSPGFSKTFQSNLPPRFQKRKLERNTSGTNLMTNSNNVPISNQAVSRMNNINSSTGTGAASSSLTNAGGEIKSGIPFAQQYDPRFIHNQQTMGKSTIGSAPGSRRVAAIVGPPARERDDRQRQPYDVREHSQREVMKGRLDSAEETSLNNHAKQQATGGGRVTPQLVRSLSESSNRKTSVSSDDNHHVGPHVQHQARHAGNNAGMSANYGREMSWDVEGEKGSSTSSPASFSGSERQRDTPPRAECEPPKQILHRLKEVASPLSSEMQKEDEVAASSANRRLKTQKEDCESSFADDKPGKDDHLAPSASSAALTDGSSSSVTVAAAHPDNMATARTGKIGPSAEITLAVRKPETNLKESVETGTIDDTSSRSNNTHQPRSANDEKQLHQQQMQHGVAKKKGVPLMQQQQHARDNNRRQDSRGGSRGSSYSGGAGGGGGGVGGSIGGGGAAPGFHRAEGLRNSSNRGGVANWNRSRGGGRVGSVSRNYSQDCWSESDFSEESFDEQSKQHQLHHQAQYHPMSGIAGQHAADGLGVVGSKEGFIPRGEPSRRGRGGGNVGSSVPLASGSANIRQQMHTPDPAGSVSKKIDGYGPPNAKSPFGGSTSSSDERSLKQHGFRDEMDKVGSAGSPTRDDRGAMKHLRSKGSEDGAPSADQGNAYTTVGEQKINAIDIDNDESHSREDKLLVHNAGSRSGGVSLVEPGDVCDTNKAHFGTIKDDVKTKAKVITSTMSTKTSSPALLQQQSKNTNTISSTTTATTIATISTGSANSSNTVDGGASYRANTTAITATGATGVVGSFRGTLNNHSNNARKQPSTARDQGVKGNSTDTSDTALSLASGSNANPLATPALPGVNDGGVDIKSSVNLSTHASMLSATEGEGACTDRHLLSQQSPLDKLAVVTSSASAKTDNEKHNLDGNTPPVNTIIFENTNYKSGVNITGLSGACSGAPVNEYASMASKAGIINEKTVAGGVAAGNVGTLMKSQQPLNANPSGHRPVSAKSVTEVSDVGLQQSIVGNSQRTVLSTVISKQQQSSNAIATSLQGIPFQKADNDYKEIKSYAFETDISHLIDGDKGIKQQSAVSAGLGLAKAIEGTSDGAVSHGGVVVSVQSIISPSTADLNMKIASVKKVWEMPTVPEQTGPAVNAGGAGGIACNVNVASEHPVGGGGSVASGNNAHLKPNYGRGGPHHQTHQTQYQNSHTTSSGHHAHGTHASYGAAFGSESDALVEHFNNSSNVCNVPSSVGANNACDITAGTVLTGECNDNSNAAAYGLSHHHAQVHTQQPPAKPHSQTQTHQLQQQQQQHHQQQDMSHQRQQHHMQEPTSQQSSQQHSQQTQKQLQQQQQQHHPSQHTLQQHTQQMQQQQQRQQQQQQHQKEQQQQQQHHLQQLQHMQQQSQPPHKSQGQPHSQLQAPPQTQPQSQTPQTQTQPPPLQQLKSQQQPQQQPQQLSQQLPQQMQQSQSQLPHQHQQHPQAHKQSQNQQQQQQQPLQQQLQQQHPVQQHPHQLQQSHHQQPLQMQHQQQQAQQQSQQHQTAVAVSMGLNKHPVADVLAAAVGANNVNVCKVKPTQQGSGGMHQSNSMGLSPPPQMQSGSMPSGPQPFFPAQYGVSAIPSPPAVLYNSPAAAAAAMSSQGGLYNAFQIEPSGRSQFSQFPGHYGTSATAGPYNAYVAATPTNMQAGPTPEMFQSLSSQFRMGSVQSPYSQSTQMGNPNTMLISSNNNSLMSSSVKSSTPQIGAIGQPKPSGGSVSQPPYGQQYLNMFPPAPMQNTAASYYSNSAGGQNAFFGTAGATGATAQNAYGIPAGAVAASSMFGGHGGQNPSNTPQPPPPQQQMPSYSSQYLNSPLLAAANPSMGQQQYRGAPTNSSQHSGAAAAAYIKSNQSPQSSHIQHQQQQQQPDTWDLQNQLIQHQQQSAPPQQQPLLSTGQVGLPQPQTNQHSSSQCRNMIPTNQGHNQLVSGGGNGNGNSVIVSGGTNGNAGSSSVRGPPQAQGSGVSGTRYPSPIQRPINFSHASVQGLQHHQQRVNRPVGHGSQQGGGNNNGGQQQGGGSSSVGPSVNNSSKHYYGGNRG